MSLTLKMPHKITVAITAGVGTIASVAVFSGYLVTIGSSFAKIKSFLFGGAPAAISLRDVRPSVSSTLPTMDWLTITIEMVVTNSGDQSANNCTGEFIFSNGVSVKGFVPSMIPDHPARYEGGSTETLSSFVFAVRSFQFQKEGSFRMLCDQIVTQLVPVDLPDPVLVPNRL
jgi:hypothetical protein